MRVNILKFKPSEQLNIFDLQAARSDYRSHMGEVRSALGLAALPTKLPKTLDMLKQCFATSYLYSEEQREFLAQMEGLRFQSKRLTEKQRTYLYNLYSKSLKQLRVSC